MAFSVAELAAAMGVDDPQRVFKKKTQAVKDRERFLAIVRLLFLVVHGPSGISELTLLPIW